jgi:hypothetical protein
MCECHLFLLLAPVLVVCCATSTGDAQTLAVHRSGMHLEALFAVFPAWGIGAHRQCCVCSTAGGCVIAGYNIITYNLSISRCRLCEH